MKSKIIIRLILVAVIACAAYFCYPSVHQFFLKYQHPLDDIYEYDGQEITIRNLFVASSENILYASHLNVSGRRENYLSSASYSTNNTRTINLGDSESISYTDLEYERFYIDSDNYVWTVSGTGRDSELEYYNFIIFKDQSYESLSSFKYYEGMIDGQEYTAYEYSGSEAGTSPDVVKILVPDLNKMENTSVSFNNTPDSTGRVSVTFTGENLHCIAEAFGEEVTSSQGYTQIEYVFDYKSKNLLSVTLSGSQKFEVNDYNQRIQTLSFTVDDISFDACENIEIPKLICENSLINDVFSGDTQIQPSPIFKTEMADNLEQSDIISNIWSDTINSFPKGICTVSDLSNSLIDNAKELGFDLVMDGYVINDENMGALIKLTISQSEAEIGCIVMPLVVSGDGIINENNLLISAGDTMSVDNKCCIKVYHTVSDSLSSVTCYSFQLESFDFAYSILKEAKISNLLNDEELSLFAGADSENLRTFASDYKQAEYSSIDKYVIKEGDTQCGYYVIEDEIHPDEYGTIYELSIVSLDTVEKKTSKYGNESEVSWQSFDE